MKINKKLIINSLLMLLILLDTVFLLVQIFYQFSSFYKESIAIFDCVVCFILFAEFIYEYKTSDDKGYYLKHNWYFIITFIPDIVLDLIFSFLGISGASGFFRLISLIRLIRVALLFRKNSKLMADFLAETYLDKILFFLIIFIIFTSFAYFSVDHSVQSFGEALWYVVVTLSTVGYGDIVPDTYMGKIIGFVLLFVGVLFFSILTGSITYFYTRRVEHKTRRELYKRIANLENKIDEIHDITQQFKEQLLERDDEERKK